MNSGTIGQITEAIIDYRGRTPPKATSGVKLLTAKVIKDGTIDETRLEYISEETYEWWMRRGFPQQWDILLTTEAPLGETCLLRSKEPVALAQRVILLRGNPSMIDQRYFFAALRSPLMQDRLRQRATGTTVLGIKQRELRQVEVPTPPLGTQRKIAGILSAYDDLIENNNRRIKILEEMAKRLYKEWFVDFRFPGHEGVSLVDTELGPTPQGWVVSSLGERFDVVLGGTPSRSVARYWDAGTVPSINSSRVNDLRVIEPTELITQEAVDRSNTKLMPKGTTLIAITGATLGQVSRLEIEACANQSVIGVYDPHGVLNEYLFLTIKQNIGRIIGAASGGAQQHINQGDVYDTLIRIPDPDVVNRARTHLEPIFDEQALLLWSLKNLRNTRELLLPRLISGVIDVSNLAITLPEIAA